MDILLIHSIAYLEWTFPSSSLRYVPFVHRIGGRASNRRIRPLELNYNRYDLVRLSSIIIGPLVSVSIYISVIMLIIIIIIIFNLKSYQFLFSYQY